MNQPLDQDDVALLIERAAERGDLDQLRHLADAGSKDALDQLIESAAEQENLDELRRLAATGNEDAADILTELTDDEIDM